ncbi:helix-turn-helix domain-containing protein [Saccharopolyspora sp. NPDC047091]|uniref:helix-turn-helix domain-containing protein n=1 Tax=Saccharopolyspora sp. NPDC047091 TaxID=3155924 RepID=UPI0033E04E0B
MSQEMYSAEQVAERLGLHVRTVRGYIRSGRLGAVRIGKQYRIAASELAALTGLPPEPATAPAAEVTSVVHVDGVDRTAADRLGTLLLAGAGTGPDGISVQTSHDPRRDRLRIVLLGEPAGTAAALDLLAGVLDDLLHREGRDG